MTARTADRIWGVSVVTLLVAMLTHGGCYSVQTAKEEALVIREARALIHHYHVSGNATWDARVIQWEDDARPYLPQPSPAPTQAPRKE